MAFIIKKKNIQYDLMNTSFIGTWYVQIINEKSKYSYIYNIFLDYYLTQLI